MIVASVRPDDRVEHDAPHRQEPPLPVGRGVTGGDPVLGGRLGLSPVMIGRQSALGRLRRLAADASFHLVLLSGEAGIGKTRLLRELAAATSRPVLAGSAEPTAMSRPFALVEELLGGPVGPGGAPDAVAVTTAVAERFAAGGTVVVFEDLHWADAASVEVFERLAQLQPPGVLLVGTYRSEELTRRLPGGDMLARLERRHDVERIRLDRLDRSEVAAFLASVHRVPLPSNVNDAMYERTGGNPFFLEELAACCTDVPVEKLASQPLPWSLEEVVRRQLDGLSPPERRLAEAAAVLGSSASFDVLAAVARLGEDELLARLRSLVDDGILVEHHDDHFTFRHALVRDAVEQHLLGRERRRLHERALELLAGHPGTPHAELARHAAGAGRYDEMVAHARRGAVVELREHGSTHLALRLATEALGEEPDDVELLHVAIEAAWLIGFTDEALASAQHLEAVARSSGSLPAAAAAARWLVRLAHDRGDADSVEAHVAELEHLLDEPLEPMDRALTLASLAQISMLRDRHDAAIEWADRAIEAAVAIGAEAVRIQALVERGSARTIRDRTSTADLEAAVAEAEAHGHWVLATRGLNNLFGAVPVHSDAGRRLLDRFRDAAGRAGFDAMTSVVSLVRQAELGFGIGDMAMVEDCLARLEEWRPLYQRDTAFWYGALHAQVELEYRRRIDPATVEQAPSGLGAWAHTCATPGRPAFLELIAAANEGKRSQVRELLGPVMEGQAGRDPLAVVEVVLAALHASLDPDEVVATVRPFAEQSGPWLGELVGALGDHAARRHAAAVHGLRAVLEQPDESLAAPTLGHLWTVVGVSELALGRRDAAAEAADRAEHHLARWAGWRVARLADLVARLDTREPEVSSELTTREREVAALLAEGLSNGELAKRLYISPKTASVHVSNILMKLGMANRTEVAAWVVRTGLAGGG